MAIEDKNWQSKSVSESLRDERQKSTAKDENQARQVMNVLHAVNLEAKAKAPAVSDASLPTKPAAEQPKPAETDRGQKNNAAQKSAEGNYLDAQKSAQALKNVLSTVKPREPNQTVTPRAVEDTSRSQDASTKNATQLPNEPKKPMQPARETNAAKTQNITQNVANSKQAPKAKDEAARETETDKKFTEAQVKDQSKELIGKVPTVESSQIAAAFLNKPKSEIKKVEGEDKEEKAEEPQAEGASKFTAAPSTGRKAKGELGALLAGGSFTSNDGSSQQEEGSSLDIGQQGQHQKVAQPSCPMSRLDPSSLVAFNEDGATCELKSKFNALSNDILKEKIQRIADFDYTLGQKIVSLSNRIEGPNADEFKKQIIAAMVKNSPYGGTSG